MAGEYQDLVGVGQLRESGGGAERPCGVEVYENFIDNDGERFCSLSKFADQSEAKDRKSCSRVPRLSSDGCLLCLSASITATVCSPRGAYT